MGPICNLKRPVTLQRKSRNSFPVHVIVKTMKQIKFVIFVGLLFSTLTLAKESRQFKKSYIAEFTRKWPTLRAQSAVCTKRINFFSNTKYNVYIFSWCVVCFATTRKDVTVILLKMVFAVLEHFTELRRKNQPHQIKPVMWILKVWGLGLK